MSSAPITINPSSGSSSVIPQSFNQFPPTLLPQSGVAAPQTAPMMFSQGSSFPGMGGGMGMNQRQQQYHREVESDVISLPVNRMLSLTKSQTKIVKKNLKKMRRSGNTDGGILLAIPFAFYDGKKKHHSNKFLINDDSSSSSSSSSSSESSSEEVVRRKRDSKKESTKASDDKE